MSEISKELLHNCGVIPVLYTYSQELADIAYKSGLAVVAVGEKLYYEGKVAGEIPKDSDILIGTFEDAALSAAMKSKDVCAVVDLSFTELETEAFAKRCCQSRKIALGYEFAHVGLNHKDADAAIKTAAFLEKAFGFPGFDIGSSIIVEGSFELVKSQFRGQNGHIGIETASVARAIADLTAKGFLIDAGSIQYSADQRIQSAYFMEETAEFGWHLIQKR